MIVETLKFCVVTFFAPTGTEDGVADQVFLADLRVRGFRRLLLQDAHQAAHGERCDDGLLPPAIAECRRAE